MVRTQVQIPDELYRLSKQLAGRLEISLAELVRRGLEYEVSTSPALLEDDKTGWQLPDAKKLGSNDPFQSANWREELHTEHLKVAEDENCNNKKQTDK